MNSKQKLQLERTQFERKKLKLELQMKELEMQHQLWESKQELERKLQITALKNDNVRSSSTKARDVTSRLSIISQKREMSLSGQIRWAKHELQFDQKPALISALNRMKIGIIHDIPSQTEVTSDQISGQSFCKVNAKNR